MSSPETDSWEIVDTHVHLFDLDDPTLRYTWLDPSNPHGILSPDEVARTAAPRAYRAPDFLEDAAEGGVAHGVHVQAAVGIDDPVVETAWLEAQRLEHGFPDAIVGHVDLAADDAAAVLDRHQEASPVFVGVRDFGVGDFLHDPAWLRGYAELGRRGLAASVDLTWETMDAALEVARAYPGVTMVVDHMGMPMRRDDEYLARWAAALGRLAAAPNVVCKISEQCMVMHTWDEPVASRCMSACVDAFGPDRCFIGSNWPVEGLYVSYGELMAATRRWASAYNPDERSAMLSGNARALYRLPSVPAAGR